MTTAGNPGFDKFGRPIVAPDYAPAGRANIATFATKNITPPSALYIQRDDQLRVRAWSSAVGATIGFSYRLLETDSGQITSGFINLAPTTNRLATDFNIPLAEGFLLSIVAGINLGVSNRGELFVDVAMMRASGSPLAFFAQMLLSDYITGFSPLGWPGGFIRSSLEGPGVLQSIAVGNPAAGADWTQAVPADARWRVQAIHATLTTGAAVANRIPEYLADDGVNNLFRGMPNQVVVASQTVAVSGSSAVVPAAANITEVMVPLTSPLYLKAGQRIKSNTINMQAADQWSNIRLSVEEWIDTLG